MSTPLIWEQQLIGVLTLYSVDTDAYTDDHKRIMEFVGRQVSQTIHHALKFERHRAIDLRDRATGLPNLRHFEQMFAASSSTVLPGDSISIISVVLKHTGIHVAIGGTTAIDRIIETVVFAVRKALRGGDLLFRYAHNELIVLLTQTDSETAAAVADRIKITTSSELKEHFASQDLSLEIVLGVATAPATGLSVQELVKAARIQQETRSPERPNPPSVH